MVVNIDHIQLLLTCCTLTINQAHRNIQLQKSICWGERLTIHSNIWQIEYDDWLNYTVYEVAPPCKGDGE